jgi:hypothetical protein
MHLVDFLITPLAVKKPVDPIVAIVFYQEVDKKLSCYFTKRGERQASTDPNKLQGSRDAHQVFDQRPIEVAISP